MVTRHLFLPLGLTALVLGLGGGSVAGCSVLIDVDAKQCSTNRDCEALGSAFAGSVCELHVCVVKQTPADGGDGAGGAPDKPADDPLLCLPREKSSEPTVKFSFAPIFADPPPQPKPFTIQACGQLDLTCENPLFGPIEVNAGEPRDFDVPVGMAGFTGYFQITNPDTLSGLLFMGRPIVEDTVGWNVTMPSPEVVTQLALATGEVVDPELGLILSVARDCNAVALAGVTVKNSKPALSYYFVNSLPDTTLTKTGPQGAAGYANVPISTVILSGVHDSGKPLGPVSVRVKPRFISLVELFP